MSHTSLILKTKGKTIDISKASVELFFDVSGSNCILSKDYSIISDVSKHGLKKPIHQVKLNTDYGTRRGEFIKDISRAAINNINFEHQNLITYDKDKLDKIHFTVRFKLMNEDNFNTYSTRSVIFGIIGGTNISVDHSTSDQLDGSGNIIFGLAWGYPFIGNMGKKGWNFLGGTSPVPSNMMTSDQLSRQQRIISWNPLFVDGDSDGNGGAFFKDMINSNSVSKIIYIDENDNKTEYALDGFSGIKDKAHLRNGHEYELEYYWNFNNTEDIGFYKDIDDDWYSVGKTTKYPGFIKITNLSTSLNENVSYGENGKYIFEMPTAGLNPDNCLAYSTNPLDDGFITIGNGTHTNPKFDIEYGAVTGGETFVPGFLWVSPLRGLPDNFNTATTIWQNAEIYNVSIYANEWQNIPNYNILRNGKKIVQAIQDNQGNLDLRDLSGTKFCNWYDNSCNEGLDIEPTIHTYKIQDISQNFNVDSNNLVLIENNIFSTEKKALLHDVIYCQKITGQQNLEYKHEITCTSIFEDKTYKNIFACGWVADYHDYDETAAKVDNDDEKLPRVWKSVDGGRNWTTILPNVFTETTNSLNQPKKCILTNISTFIDKANNKWVFICGTKGALAFSRDLGNTWKNIGIPTSNDEPDYSFIYPADISKNISSAIFSPIDASENDFHLWIGTYGEPDRTSFGDILIRGNDISFNDSTYLSNPQNKTDIITGAINTIDAISDKYNFKNIVFGGPNKNIEDSVLRNINGMEIGYVTTDNSVLKTTNGGQTWVKILDKDMQDISGQFGITGIHINRNPDPNGGYKSVLTQPVQIHGNLGMYKDNSNNGIITGDISGSDYKFIVENNNFWDPSSNILFTENGFDYFNYGLGTKENTYKTFIDTSVEIDRTEKDISKNFNHTTSNSFDAFEGGASGSTENPYYYRKVIQTHDNYNKIILTKIGSTNNDGLLNSYAVLLDSIVFDEDFEYSGIRFKSSISENYSIIGLDISNGFVPPTNTLSDNDYHYSNRKDISNNFLDDIDYGIFIVSDVSGIEIWENGKIVKIIDETYNLTDDFEIRIFKRKIEYHKFDRVKESQGQSDWKNLLHRTELDDVIPNSTQFYVKTVLSKNDGTNTSGFKDIIKVNNRYTNDINQRFYQKDYVFFDVSNNDTGGSIYQDDGFDLLYTKDNSDNIWSKLNFSVIDPSFSIYKFNTQKFDTFLPLDISHSLIYKSEDYIGNDYEIGGDISSSFGIPKIYNGLGFFKLSKTPPTPKLKVIYPFVGNNKWIKLELHIEDTRWRFFDKLKLRDIEATSEFFWKGIDDLSYKRITNKTNFDYLTTRTMVNLAESTKFNFKCRLKNKFGYSWDSNIVTIGVPGPNIAFIEDINCETKIFENKITIVPGYYDLSNSIFSYDISKQYCEYSVGPSGERVETWKYDNYFNSKYVDISGTGWSGDDIESIEIIDNDISLNSVYMYNIRPRSINGNDAKIYDKLVLTDNGIVKNIKFDYSFNDVQTDLSVNLFHYIELDSNASVVYDFSRNDTNVYDISYDILAHDISFTNISANNNYFIQLKAKYTNNNTDLKLTSANHYDVSFSTLSYSLSTDNSLNQFNEPFSFFTFLESLTLQNVTYSSDDKLHMAFTIPKTPRIPDKFDISFSNVSTAYSGGISYSELIDISNNHTLLGTDYYPGDYNIRVRAKYANLYSDWSNIKQVTIPQHKPKNFTITDNGTSLNLSWGKPGTFLQTLTYKLDKIVRDVNNGETLNTIKNNINSTSITDTKTSSDNFVYYELTAIYI